MMKIEKLNRGESEKAMSEWIENYPNLPSVESDYLVIRNELTRLFRTVVTKAEEKGLKIQDYFTDVQFSPSVYVS